MPSLTLTFRVAFALVTAGLAVAPSAGAAELHATGGAGDCTSEQQGCELAGALAAAAAGDTVLVHAGVHGVHSAIGDTAPGVTVQGAPDEPRPVIAISGSTSGLRLTHGATLRALDIVSSSDVAVRSIGGLIDRVRVSVQGAGSAAIQLGNGAVLRNSTVSASGAGSAGVLVSTDGALTQLRGSSVVAMGSGASAVLVAPSGAGGMSSLRAVNSIVRGYGGALDVRAVTSSLETATVVLDHSASTPAGRQATGPGSAIDASRSPLTADPLFVDRGNLDLRQTSTSPTIDGGTPDLDGDGDVDAADATAAGPSDLDGTPRQLGLPDIGADERAMPPIVLSTRPVVTNGRLALEVVVQPRGLDTVITAEWWSTEFEGGAVSARADATGNSPVTLELLLGEVPSGVAIAVRARATNSAGSDTSSETAVAVPDAPAAAVAAPEASPKTSVPTPQPGAMPTLVSTKLRSHWGILDAKLRCSQPVACRGILVITRFGKSTRWVEFAVAPGATKTISMALTSAQVRKLKAAGKRGVRVLFEVRSTQMGSRFAALRLTAAPIRPRRG